MIFVDGLQLENAREPDFAYTTRNTNRITADEILQTEFQLKDTITIPIRGNDRVFIVEHIRYYNNGTKQVYFVSKDILAKSTMMPEQMNSTLDELEEGMPRKIVEMMEPIKHKRFGFKMVRKLNLLSSANTHGCNKHEGHDDILFDGFQTSVDLYKEYYRYPTWWWLCDLQKPSSEIIESTLFNLANYTGGFTGYHASGYYGVVPVFSILCPS